VLETPSDGQFLYFMRNFGKVLETGFETGKNIKIKQMELNLWGLGVSSINKRRRMLKIGTLRSLHIQHIQRFQPYNSFPDPV
jgi:hypothetical protein